MKKILLLLIVTLIASSLSAQTLYVNASNDDIRYVGRTVKSIEGVTFDWAGTYLEMNFSGDEIKVRASDSGTNFYDIVVDGVKKGPVKISEADTTVTLAHSLGRGTHHLVMQKRTEGGQGRTTLKQFIIEGKNTKLEAAPSVRERHIEFIGDSYTCGYGVESKSGDRFSGETENCNLAHGAILARLFDADYTFIANSGRGVVRNYGDKNETSDTTMRDLMLRTLNTQHTPLWDFEASPYTPDVVVIFLGINDYSTKPYPSVKTFKSGYKEIIATLRAKWGTDMPILCIAPNVHERVRESVSEMKEELGDSNLYYYAQSDSYLQYPVDFGADGHPNIKGQRKVAMLTAPYLSSIMGWEIAELPLQ